MRSASPPENTMKTPNANIVAAAQCLDVEILLASIARRLAAPGAVSTDAAREALSLAIVQDVAGFVLAWTEGAGPRGAVAAASELHPRWNDEAKCP